MSVRPQLAVAAALAAGGFAVGGFYLWPSGRHLAAACKPYLHADTPAAATHALAAFAGRILHDVNRSHGRIHDESWFDYATGRSRDLHFDARGRMTDEFVTIAHTSAADTYWISYLARSWTRNAQRLPFPLRRRNAAVDIARLYRDSVANGTMSIVAREGRTLHLRRVIQAHRIDTWVDPLTYLPMRTRQGDSESYETWLPRTPANVAKTRLVIPYGFRRVTERGAVATFTDTASAGCAQS